MARLFRNRASYKSSDVIGLFILSLFGGMLLYGLAALLNAIYDRIFGV